jgi:predicted transcriptional regulator
VLPEDLAGQLLDLLAGSPTSMDGLAALTGYSTDIVRQRLLRMEEAGCVRREKSAGPTGLPFIWHPTGVPLLDLKGDTGGNLRRDGQPHQVTVKTYPTIDRRDPLVASLFGQAGQGAA